MSVESPALNGTSVGTPGLRLREHHRKGTERAIGWGKCCAILSLGHDMTRNHEVSTAITCTRISQQDGWSTFQQAALTDLSGFLVKMGEDVM